ncbi:hypothetical protein K439DRAFT_1616882 [Ramaria rubella]|nr:hypothetical protein K439DRAFT_1616882 [Ramaria rubella]
MDNYHSEMCKGSLHQLLDSNPDDPGRQNVNFLSIPLPQNAMPPDCVQRISLIAQASQQYCATLFPADSLSWGLVATVPAMSPVHRDAGKFAMWIQVVSGTKLWSLLEDGASSPRPSDALVDIDPKDFRWTGLVFRPGHILIMHPGREHIVYTLEDSIGKGGHLHVNGRGPLSLASLVDMSATFAPPCTQSITLNICAPSFVLLWSSHVWNSVF